MKRPSGKILKNPRITEKATFASEVGAYVFDVASDATKNEIKKAVFEIFKVKPSKVNVTSISRKKVQNRRMVGTKGGGKKAYVYLKEGDKIDFV